MMAGIWCPDCAHLGLTQARLMALDDMVGNGNQPPISVWIGFDWLGGDDGMGGAHVIGYRDYYHCAFCGKTHTILTMNEWSARSLIDDHSPISEQSAWYPGYHGMFARIPRELTGQKLMPPVRYWDADQGSSHNRRF